MSGENQLLRYHPVNEPIPEGWVLGGNFFNTHHEHHETCIIVKDSNYDDKGQLTKSGWQRFWDSWN